MRVEVLQQLVLSSRRVAALLADVQLVAALLVGVLLGDAVDLLHVGLQGAALGEGLFAEGALVRTDPCVETGRSSHAFPASFAGVFMTGVWKRIATCMGSYVPLEVEGVVEAFAAEAAQVLLGLVVALDMSVQHPLVVEGLLANLQAATAPS